MIDPATIEFLIVQIRSSEFDDFVHATPALPGCADANLATASVARIMNNDRDSMLCLQPRLRNRGRAIVYCRRRCSLELTKLQED